VELNSYRDTDSLYIGLRIESSGDRAVLPSRVEDDVGVKEIHARSVRPLNSVPRQPQQTLRPTHPPVCCRECGHKPVAHPAAPSRLAIVPLDSRLRDSPNKIILRTYSRDGVSS
jgi:hypothetical protein